MIFRHFRKGNKVTSFDASEFIKDFEEGLIDEDGNSIAQNFSRIQSNKTDKFKPVGSMSEQEKRLRVNQYYQGAKEKK